MMLTNSTNPIVIVLRFVRFYLVNQNVNYMILISGNMELAFQHRGDLLLLSNYQSEPFRAGDIAVCRVKGRDIFIVHRVILVHEK